MTQDNTPLGSKIVYDGYQTASLKVSSGLIEILPEVGVLFDGDHNSVCVVLSHVPCSVSGWQICGRSLYKSLKVNEF